MASGLTPWLAVDLPNDVSELTNEHLEQLKQQALARIAAQGCNVLYEGKQNERKKRPLGRSDSLLQDMKT